MLTAGCTRAPDDKRRRIHWLTASDAEAAAIDGLSAEQRELLRPESTAMALADNHRALDQLRLRWRVVTATMQVDLNVKLFGISCSALWVGPHPARTLLASDGERRTLRAAGWSRTPMFIDGASAMAMQPDALSGVSDSFLGWQLRGASARERIDELAYAEQLGCIAIAVASRGGSPAHAELDAFEALVAKTKIPVLVRGDVDAESVTRWIGAGAGGIVLSNAERAWARPDSPVASRVLVDVVDAAGAELPVMFEGGARNGLDALKALALGATAVIVELPALWGLSAASTEGVDAALTLMHRELGTAMGMCGSERPALLERSLVRKPPWA
jgi:4-hydroxymandelate oxidase